jgi:uncharacterized protein (TIGR02217 family)
MPSFHEVQFPHNFALGARGGPSFNTAVSITSSGFEGRNVNWSRDRGKWNVGHVPRERAEMDILIAFFRARYGRAYGFRMRDKIDYQITGATIGIGDNAVLAFQLVKQYSSGGFTYTRNLTKPVTASVVDATGNTVLNTVKIYFDGTLQSSGYTIATDTGLVTFLAPPTTGVVITADAEFDIPVRFDTDQMDIEVVTPTLFSWPSLGIIELRQQ